MPIKISYMPMYVAVNLHVDDTIIIQECNFLPQQVLILVIVQIL